jgi:hypothetical protein
MSRPKKKIILFLIEGKTEVISLANSISDLYEKRFPNDGYKVFFCQMNPEYQKSESVYDIEGGDITSRHGVYPDKIEGLISKLFIQPFLEKNHGIYPKDICEIIQVVDLDGAFIDDSQIRLLEEGVTDRNIIYSDTAIYSKNISSIIERNHHKRDNIRKLVSMDEIQISHNNGKNRKKVKYSIFFFSSNMDHYIHGDANLSPREKVNLATRFSTETYDNNDLFYNRIAENPGALKGMSYTDSWEYVFNNGGISLLPHSNLNILLSDLVGKAE